jgi:hypothetical protein
MHSSEAAAAADKVAAAAGAADKVAAAAGAVPAQFLAALRRDRAVARRVMVGQAPTVRSAEAPSGLDPIRPARIRLARIRLDRIRLAPCVDIRVGTAAA